jgi:hypothetical protein
MSGSGGDPGVIRTPDTRFRKSLWTVLQRPYASASLLVTAFMRPLTDTRGWRDTAALVHQLVHLPPDKSGLR